ncbi:MAG: TetR/AcrR family transcriptional regulator [Pseudomonadota bacterium]|nr:TetR/AcrR family transcriptional regulator [Pseudomonadota bacterium]
MARKPTRERPAPRRRAAPPATTRAARGATERDRIVEALMALLAEQPIERIGFGDIAGRAGVSLAQLRGEFSSALAILAAHIKEIDRKVLAGGEGDMAEEPARERLFDVLMRRLEVLSPYKQAVRSLLRSSARNPGLAFALNGLGVRSQQWMLTAADIKASGPKGMMRSQGLALLFARVLCVWVDDQDPGLARTMAALDRELARGERWAGFLDDVCMIPEAFCRPGGWRARRRSERDEAAAA